MVRVLSKTLKQTFHDRLESLNRFIFSSDQTRTFNLLDTIIKEKEIKTCISKLKNNKASGLDSIRNEILKAGATILLPCMNKLFNLIFSSGIYPFSWGKGYITPLFKTRDNAKPENYRGITITSNIGTLLIWYYLPD